MESHLLVSAEIPPPSPAYLILFYVYLNTQGG